ncbi:MAG: tetratricopeptide repeat protein [Gammaproteobacteria bacterium]|nr:tetratricopeptide repeat protein [Gammaproteobacteria bacterium]
MKTNSKQGRLSLFVLFLSGYFSITSLSLAQDEERLEIRNLHFGETLYHFYQKQYFTAISDLLVAQKKHPIQTQGENPNLLLGGLYLSYNMTQRAGNIFTSLTQKDISKRLQSSAWYYLARIAYQNSELEKANLAVNKIGVHLPFRYNDELQHLQGNILLKQKNYKDAIKILSQYSDSTDWSHYTKFNLAIALIMADENEKGTELLEEVAELDAQDIEQIALRDKANLALGYAALKAKDNETAADYFRQIRLSGSQSNKALLGIGWAFHKEGKLKRSLVPWVELKNRSSKDPAVQEALLTIPHALEGLNAKEQALAYYNDAINSYNKELATLKSVINSVKQGEFIKSLRVLHLHQQKENHLHFTTLPDSTATPYLQSLIAGQEFQSILKNYRDLLYMKNILTHWNNQIPSYRLMLNEREKAYDSRIPKISAFMKNTQQTKLLNRYRKLKSRLEAIEKNHVVFALASEQEMNLLNKLSKIKKLLDKVPPGQLEEQHDQYRLFKGILYWQVATDYTPRYWQVKKRLLEIEKAFSKLEKKKTSSLTTLVKTPEYFKDFANNINNKQRKIKNLNQQISNVIKYQESLINRIAIDELTKQKHLIENYHIRASYSLTRLYDSLAVVEKK